MRKEQGSFPTNITPLQESFRFTPLIGSKGISETGRREKLIERVLCHRFELLPPPETAQKLIESRNEKTGYVYRRNRFRSGAKLIDKRVGNHTSPTRHGKFMLETRSMWRLGELASFIKNAAIPTDKTKLLFASFPEPTANPPKRIYPPAVNPRKI